MSGSPDVIMMIHMTSTGASGKTDRPLSSLKARPIKRVQACAMLQARTCSTNFWILSNMRRPSSTALRMLAKLSSVRMMSEASLATSDPLSPMAMPTSARLRDGESLTPSPVMATKRLRRWSASIMRTFVCGAQRATTSGRRGRRSIWSSLSLSKSLAAMTMVLATLVELLDRRRRLGTGRVVDANEALEDELVFKVLAVEALVVVDLADVALAGQRQDAQTELGQDLEVGSDVLLVLLGERDDVVSHLDLVAGRNDALRGALGEEARLAGFRVLEDDRHLLDVRVEGELGDLVPALALSREAETVPVEAGGEDLDGDLGRVAAGMPLAFLGLVHRREVGQRGEVEVVSQQWRVQDPLLGLVVGDQRTLGVGAAEVDLAGLLRAVADLADGGVERLAGLADRVGAVSGNPSLADNHVTLRQSAGLVRADVGDAAEGFEGLELAHNDMALNHPFGTGGHGDSQDDDERGRKHGNTGRHGVDDNFLRGVELVGTKDDDGANDGGAEEDDGQLCQLALQRSSDVHTQETTNGVSDGQGPGLHVPANTSRAVLLALDRPALRVFAAEGRSDLANLGVHASREDDAPRTTFGDGRRAVSHVEAISRSRVVVVGLSGFFTDRERLAGQERLVGLKVDSLNDAHVGRDGTISTVGTVVLRPSRTACAVGELRDRSESIVFAALSSCWKPTVMFKRMTAATTQPSMMDSMPKDAAMARISTKVMALAICAIRMFQGFTPSCSPNSLRPNSSRRFLASAGVRPSSGFACSSSTTFSVTRAWGGRESGLLDWPDTWLANASSAALADLLGMVDLATSRVLL
ncbi:hypothetical protein PpBr36_00031 [Pyricularia pennisetigena]|uniref:hypothetical protein n=1 Tax=Pyricularia pennisetigena TaxID=1578925 RepID=UPI00115023AC|nr:hypothetical protein PpBr36_00031 [Pyricularia pennisetigena]TLS28199.1 hypothetical protein PpBr36_00031 [Pyricularia pennisetigena]